MIRNIYAEAIKILPKEYIDHHTSDLYLKKTAESEKLIAEYEFKKQVETFTDNITHTTWYDIPFAFTPFWDEVNKGNNPHNITYPKEGL